MKGKSSKFSRLKYDIRGILTLVYEVIKDYYFPAFIVILLLIVITGSFYVDGFWILVLGLFLFIVLHYFVKKWDL